MAIAELRLTDRTVENCYLYQAQGVYSSCMLDIVLFITSMRHVIYQGYITWFT